VTARGIIKTKEYNDLFVYARLYKKRRLLLVSFLNAHLVKRRDTLNLGKIQTLFSLARVSRIYSRALQFLIVSVLSFL
jgi:hypothetical protein